MRPFVVMINFDNGNGEETAYEEVEAEDYQEAWMLGIEQFNETNAKCTHSTVVRHVIPMESLNTNFLPYDEAINE